jgi:hypothetical protein
MAPLGMKVTVHEKPKSRGTWSAHGKLAFYTGPAMDHYRCFSVHVLSTRSTRVSDTIEWHPHDCDLPAASPVELITEAAHALSDSLQILSESNIVTANHAQPLAIELISLISLFSEQGPPSAPSAAAEQRVPTGVPQPAGRVSPTVAQQPPVLGPPTVEPQPAAFVLPTDVPQPAVLVPHTVVPHQERVSNPAAREQRVLPPSAQSVEQ